MRTTERDPLALIALVCRRGEGDLRALAAIARGQEIDAEEERALVRAGLLKVGPEGPRIPPQLIAPVLALDSSLGVSGVEVISDLISLLEGASDKESEREVVLDALFEQLGERLHSLKEKGRPPSDADELSEVLRELSRATERLQDEGLSVSRATRLSALCARLIEQLAQHAQPRKKRKAHRALPTGSPERLAAAARGLSLSLTQTLLIASPERLQAALMPKRTPTINNRIAQIDPAHSQKLRRAAVERSIKEADPALSLYGGQDAVEALRRHAILIGISASGWRERGLLSVYGRREGPAPLAWSSPLERKEAQTERNLRAA